MLSKRDLPPREVVIQVKVIARTCDCHLEAIDRAQSCGIRSCRSATIAGKNLLINTSCAISACSSRLLLISPPPLSLSLSLSLHRSRAAAFLLRRRVQPSDNASNYARPNVIIINGGVCINRGSIMGFHRVFCPDTLMDISGHFPLAWLGLLLLLFPLCVGE